MPQEPTSRNTSPSEALPREQSTEHRDSHDEQPAANAVPHAAIPDAGPYSTPGLSSTHGPVRHSLSEGGGRLQQRAPGTKATGLGAVVSSFRYAIGEAGLKRGALPLLQVNQKDGFDCPGCAWPESDGKRPRFDFCENGAKAIAHESDRRLVTAEFFAAHSVAELSEQTDYWLEQQGRLITPMLLRSGATHYEPLSWNDAFALIAQELNLLESPDEAIFYTSGKAPNEAAFAYQLLARQFGTNNLPDCSNMCHEASGGALRNMLGFGKGTVTLEDFGKTELIFVVGHNPGSNHPRMLTALQEAKRNGAKIISVNPLPEAGLMSFMNPQEALGLLGKGTKLTDLLLQVRVNGDVPLFKGILKTLVELDDRRPGTGIHWEFVNSQTSGIDELLQELRVADWTQIERAAGVPRAQIEQAATWAAQTERIIVSWCLGVTQHQNGTENVQELLNLLLLRGALAKPGAGACCVRGHSNVQGDRTMGVWERPGMPLLAALARQFRFEPPREPGVDSQRAVKAMHAGTGKVLISLGGNFLLALSDTAYTAEALKKTALTVRIGTKLNRSDLVTGRQALILPCLGRTEADLRAATDTRPEREMFCSCENSMGVVQATRGRFPPVAPGLMNETEIVCRIAAAALGDRTQVDWLAWADDYDLIRDGVAAVIPGFEQFNARVRQPGGFYLPNPPREGKFPTPSGKAMFTVNPIREQPLQPGQLLLTTLRSHDQFNTTIYGLHDRYRGLFNERRVIMLHPDDLQARGLTPHQPVDVCSHFEGQRRYARNFLAVSYPVPRGCATMYYPEANILIPIGSTDAGSNCPSFKSTIVSVQPAQGSVETV